MIATRTLKCPGGPHIGDCDYKVHMQSDWEMYWNKDIAHAPKEYMDEIELFLAHLTDVHGPNGIFLLVPTLEGKYQE
jgi:hypothetical protein